MPIKTAKTAEKANTTPVELTKSSRVGQLTLENSARTSLTKLVSLFHIPFPNAEAWQGRQDLNLQPPVLETGALPIELLPYA